MRAFSLLAIVWLRAFTALSMVCADEVTVHIRANQIGYLSKDEKIAVAFSTSPLTGTFSLVKDDSGEPVFSGPLVPCTATKWGGFEHHYWLDFGQYHSPGRYRLRIDQTEEFSRPFTIGDSAYGDAVEDVLRFMRQQRCGYNPILDCVCHQRDGRTAYGPMPAGTFVDASGGWHDAGDQLKYLLTGSNATAQMLLAYEMEPSRFDDRVDRLGHPLPNGVPDVLDEARWGLEWLLKLHPKPNELFHQVADDRDHNGWKLPDEDSSDYGWGPHSYRVVYFADGKPQGLREHQSAATGIGNLAGRYAAAMAAAHRIWKRDLAEPTFARQCLDAAKSVYAMGRVQQGFQQGNSYGAPYRYSETTWADDMEWGAAELFAETGQDQYLQDALRFAGLAADISWMPFETTDHYQYYPFVNVGHYALYPHVDAEQRAILAGYYRAGIEATVKRAQDNPFRIGVPFIWCSNNLATALITQILLYEKMTGDLRYHGHLLAQRDWLFGCNPWGTTMFTELPTDGEYPEDVHTSVWKLARRAVAGGLVDGPVDGKVYRSLIGLHLTDEDEFAAFQTEQVVYHDDVGDYSTNEPTMDGTAGAVLMMAHFGVSPEAARSLAARGMGVPDPTFKLDAGGIRRGRDDRRQLSLIFTADEHVEGAEVILQTLESRGVQAAFFLTGRALAAPGMHDWVRRAVSGGHYLGPHSHAHLLYAAWENRQQSLLEKRRLQADLYCNLSELRDLGVKLTTPIYFVPPFEWYNADHANWAAELGCQIISFTPGSGSHRDFAPEGHEAFVSSRALLKDILTFESHAGLKGHLLLLHLGSARQDKLYPHLSELIDELQERQYSIVRLDTLLGRPSEERHAERGN